MFITFFRLGRSSVFCSVNVVELMIKNTFFVFDGITSPERNENG